MPLQIHFWQRIRQAFKVWLDALLAVNLFLSERRFRSALEAERRLWNAVPRDPKPLISVTIATYNRGRILFEKVLPSVLAQSYENLEVVIVGDGCTDETADLMATVQDKRVRFLNLKERGNYPQNPRLRWMVAGWLPITHAQRMARGEWISHLDDDEIMLPSHLENLLRFARERDYELVHAKAEVEDVSGAWRVQGSDRFPSGRWPYQIGGVLHSTVLFRAYLRLFPIIGTSHYYRRAADNLCWLWMGRAGVRSGFFDQVVTHSPLVSKTPKQRL